MVKEKRLQKVTKFSDLDTTEKVGEYLIINPDKADDLIVYFEGKLNNSLQQKEGVEHIIVDLMCECLKYKKQENSESILRNITYETNHSQITTCIHNYILENNCFPTVFKITETTGLSRQTVYRHLDSGLKNKFNALVKGKLEYMATHALSKLYLIGIKDDNVSALKHFIELSGAINRNPREKVNSYIQINNVTITQEDIKNLPPKSIEAIKNLLSEARNDGQVIDIEQIPKTVSYSSSPKD